MAIRPLAAGVRGRWPVLPGAVAVHLAIVVWRAAWAPPLDARPGLGVVSVAGAVAVIAFAARLWRRATGGCANRAAARDRRVLSALVVIFAASRVAWILAVPTKPVSDYLGYETIARMVARGGPIRMPWPFGASVASWGYPVAIGLVLRLLGAPDAPLLAMKLANVALGTAALLLLHRLVRRVAGRTEALVAAALFALWPGQLYMTSVLATEHLAAPLVLATALLGLPLLAPPAIAAAGTPGRLAGVPRALATGLAAAAAIATRAALVSLPAALVVALWRWRSPAARAAALAAALLAATAAGTIAYRGALRAAYGAAPLPATWWTVLTGTSLESGGNFSRPDRDRYFAHRSIAEADAYAGREIARRLREQPAALAQMAWEKTVRLWLADDYAIGWSTAAPVVPGASMPERAWLAWPAQVVHLATLALAVAGCVAIARRVRAGQGAPGTDLVLLAIAAGTLVHAIAEAHARYHYVLQPLAIALAAIGAASGGASGSAGAAREGGAVDMARAASSPVGDRPAPPASDGEAGREEAPQR